MGRSESMVPLLRRAALGLLLPAGCLALGACGSGLDMAAVEKSVQEGLVRQLGLQVTSVSCPHDGRAARSGATFECTAKPATGGSLLVEVTQKDAAGDIGWRVTKSIGLFDLQAAAAAVEQGLRDQLQLELAVSCGERWQAGSAGDFFECVGEGNGVTRTIVITVKDDAGNISWKLQ